MKRWTHWLGVKSPDASTYVASAAAREGDLRRAIDATALGFQDTTELDQQALPWIGQERAEQAARFGLQMDLPDYHLFVLGEVGSGRSTLLRQVMHEVAATRAVPPDLCYLHNFDAPEKPRALRLPPGQGRLLRQLMVQMCTYLSHMMQVLHQLW